MGLSELGQKIFSPHPVLDELPDVPGPTDDLAGQHRVVEGPVDTVDDLALCRGKLVDVLLHARDLDLGRESGEVVARRLHEWNVPFVFWTANRGPLPQGVSIEKCDMRAVVMAVTQALQAGP